MTHFSWFVCLLFAAQLLGCGGDDDSPSTDGAPLDDGLSCADLAGSEAAILTAAGLGSLTGTSDVGAGCYVSAGDATVNAYVPPDPDPEAFFASSGIETVRDGEVLIGDNFGGPIAATAVGSSVLAVEAFDDDGPIALTAAQLDATVAEVVQAISN